MIEKLHNNRVLWLDICRITATFAVIFLHISGSALYLDNIDYDWLVSSVADSFVRWAVPVFVMISGALFLNPLKELSIKTVILKYVARLLKAYVFWWIFYSLLRVGYDTLSNGTFYFRMGYFVPHSHLWFLPMLAGVYMLIPFLRKIVMDEKLFQYALFLWGICLTLGFSLLPEFPQLSRLFHMNMIIGYSGYFLLGRFLGTYVFTKKQKKYIYVVGSVGFLITALGTIVYCKLHYTVGGVTIFLDNLTPWVAAMAVAVFVFIKDINWRTTGIIYRFIEYVRKDLFGIYLTHAIYLMLLNVPAVRGLCNLAIMIPLLTIIIFFLSLYTTKMLRKLPRVKYVIE